MHYAALFMFFFYLQLYVKGIIIEIQNNKISVTMIFYNEKMCIANNNN